MDSALGNCPKCKQPLDVEKCSWGGGHTEFGTDYWTFDIECTCGWDFETSGWGEHTIEDIEIVKEQIEGKDPYD